MQLKYSTRLNIMACMTALYIISIAAIFIYPTIITGISFIVISSIWFLGFYKLLPTEE